MSGSRPFKMTISLDVLQHLGIGLYSNIPAVLSELVANAWDADATKVEITLDTTASSITIRDDGHGMSADDINDKFLKVGYERRRSNAKTPGGRIVMGRKGIGKLAAFSIADTVDVHTSDGTQSHAFRMNTDEIKAAAKRSNPYYPGPIAPRVAKQSSGTLIVLTDLRRRPTWASPYLRKRLARRFSVIGSRHGFSVHVGGEPITIDDRDYFGELEFIWHFGEPADDWDFSRAPAGDNCGTVPCDALLESGTDRRSVRHSVRGFIGTVEKPAFRFVPARS